MLKLYQGNDLEVNIDKLNVACQYAFVWHRTASSLKSSNEWEGWSSDSALHAAGNGSSARKGKKKTGRTKEGLLIDLAEDKGNEWNSRWDDDAWEMLNKKE